MLLKSCSSCSFRFSHIGARARCRVGTCTWNMVDKANSVFFLDFVFGFDKDFAQGASRSDRCANAFGVEESR